MSTVKNKVVKDALEPRTIKPVPEKLAWAAPVLIDLSIEQTAQKRNDPNNEWQFRGKRYGPS